MLYDILHKLTNIKIICNQIVDGIYIASYEFVSDRLDELASPNYLAPALSLQCILWRRLIIPIPTTAKKVWPVNINALFYFG